MTYYKLILLLLLMALFTSCHNNDSPKKINEPDYSNSFYWASNPDTIAKGTDVFFVYPTIFGGTGVMNMDLDNMDLRQRVLHVIPKQAGVFKEDCNIFTPYYRQMAMDGLSMSEEINTQYLSIGYHDLENAFEYYLKHLNQGRPFILAGHSQGSLMLIKLMKDKFMQTELMEKMVAAYIIGYSITDDDLVQCPWFKISTAADDIGCIISYNTQSVSAKGSPVLLANAHAVNPLNWTNTTTYAPKESNLGAVFFKDNGSVDTTIMHFTDAYINQEGALIAGSADSSIYSSSSFPPGVYHIYDYSFYFNNLKENVGLRIQAYKDENVIE